MSECKSIGVSDSTFDKIMTYDLINHNQGLKPEQWFENSNQAPVL